MEISSNSSGLLKIYELYLRKNGSLGNSYLHDYLIIFNLISFQTYKMHLPQIWSLRYNWKARCPLLIGYKHYFWKDLCIPMVLADYFGCFDCLLLDLHDSYYCCPFYAQNDAPGTYFLLYSMDRQCCQRSKSTKKDFLGRVFQYIMGNFFGVHGKVDLEDWLSWPLGYYYTVITQGSAHATF